MSCSRILWGGVGQGAEHSPMIAVAVSPFRWGLMCRNDTKTRYFALFPQRRIVPRPSVPPPASSTENRKLKVEKFWQREN